LDLDKIEIMAADQTANEFCKFELEPFDGNYDQPTSPIGQLVLDKCLIESLLSKEKKIVQKLSNKMGIINEVNKAY
jgi:hypothetical protein